MRCLLTVLFILGAATQAMSLDFSKLPKQTQTDEITPLQLFVSPIQPGGSYGLTVNLGNLWKGLTKKYQDKTKLLDEYAKVLVEYDEELVRLRNDDRPEKGFWKRYKALKAEKLAQIKADLIARYTHAVLSDSGAPAQGVHNGLCRGQGLHDHEEVVGSERSPVLQDFWPSRGRQGASEVDEGRDGAGRQVAGGEQGTVHLHVFEGMAASSAEAA